MIKWLTQQPSFIRRTLALMMLLVLMSSSWVIMVVPVVDMNTKFEIMNSQIAGLIQRDRNLIAAGPVIKENLAFIRSEVSSSPLFFRDKSDADAIAEFETQVQNRIIQDGGEVQSIEPMAITAESGLSVLSLQLNFSIPIQGFPILLKELETSLPVKFISNAVIQSNAVTDMSAGSSIPNQQLSIDWTISTYCHVDRPQ